MEFTLLSDRSQTNQTPVVGQKTLPRALTETALKIIDQ